MFEIIFLFVLAIIWMSFAIIQDARTTEISNWLNFSLIIFALGFRFFYSLFFQVDFNFFYHGLIGLTIFFILGNFLYNMKMFAGGDYKMFFSLGVVLPLYGSLSQNLEGFLFFLFVFFVIGAVYSIITSLILCVQHYSEFKKEFRRQFRNKKKIVNLATLVAVIIGLISLFTYAVLFYLALITLLIPYLYLYAKAVDEAAMIRKIGASKLMEGDWLYKDVRVGKKTIRATWDGLTKEEIIRLRKHKKEVWIRSGVPFTGVFLISMLIYFYFFFIGLRYPFW